MLEQDASEHYEQSLDRAFLRRGPLMALRQRTFRQLWRFLFPPLRMVLAALVYLPLRRLGLPWTLASLLCFLLPAYLLSLVIFLITYDPDFLLGPPALKLLAVGLFWWALMALEEGLIRLLFGRPVMAVGYLDPWAVVKNLAYLLLGAYLISL